MRARAGLLLLAFAMSPARAATYHVAMHHPKADDHGPGTTEHPWRTLTKAAETVVAGDTMVVHRGTYREQVQLANSGAGPDAMITIRAAPGEVVTISALDEVTAWEKVREGLWRSPNWAVETQMVLVDGHLPLQQIGPSFLTRKGWMKQVGEDLDDIFPGAFYYDPETQALYVASLAGRRIDWNVYEAAARDYCLYVGEWTRVEGMRCVGSNYSRKTTWPALSCRSNCIIEDCEVLWSDLSGFAINCDNVTLRRCRINHAGGTGITMAGQGHRIEDCETSYCNWRPVVPGWHAGGIKNVRCTDCIVRRHVAAFNWGPGIWFDIDCRDCVIEESLCYHNGVGIHYEISFPAVIRNNVCVDNMRGIWSSTSRGVRIEHNTVVGGAEGVVMNGHDRGQAEDGETLYRLADNVAVRNLVAGTSDFDLMLTADSAHSGDNRSDENLFGGLVDGPPRFVHWWGGEVFVGLDAWRAESGQEAHSIHADPGLRDRRGFDLLPAEPYRGYGARREVLSWARERLAAVR